MIADPSSGGILPDIGKEATEAWQLLVHVCRRWRSLVFGSPRRLNLRLFCTSETPIRDTLEIWPALLLVVDSGVMAFSSSMDNIFGALEQSNRVCKVNLYVTSSLLEKVLAQMQVPFPELTDLRLSKFYSFDETPPFIPDSFLGGSTPRLRHLTLDGIPFPGLPKLLLTATHLVDLMLTFIPYSENFSPKAMAALLSALSRLRILSLIFQPRQPGTGSGWESQSLPLRSILPALDHFIFNGDTEYLEDFVTHIDAPQLNKMDITLYSQIGTPRLAQFINRTSLRAGDKALVEFYNLSATVQLPARVEDLRISIYCNAPGLQLSSVAHVCNPLHSFSTVEDLYIGRPNLRLAWIDEAIESTLWLQLLRPFTAVKNLYLSNVFAPIIAAALQEFIGDIADVLPSLQNIFVERLEPSDFLQENFRQFVTARQLSDHPIAVFDWISENESHATRKLRPCSPSFTFILYYSSRARSLMLLNSPHLLLTSFFLLNVSPCLGIAKRKRKVR